MVVKNPSRIAVWSAPRIVATGLMYSFGQREDTNVVDEPMHAYHLGFTGKEVKWREEVLQSMDKDPDSILNTLMYCDLNKRVLLIKNMAHQVVGLQWDFLLEFKNVFLIEEPSSVIHDFVERAIEPDEIDLSFSVQYQMLLYLIEHGIEPIVIESESLIANLENILRQLCERLHIKYDPDMMHWSKDLTGVEGKWGKYWYESIRKKRSFSEYQTKPIDLNGKHKALYNNVFPYYERMEKYALKAD